MSLEQDLRDRSGNGCELCGGTTALDLYEVRDAPTADADAHIFACETCRNQLENPQEVDTNHWRCLNDSMWSQVSAVQVIAYRMLHHLRAEGWPQDLLDMMYMKEPVEEWAKASLVDEPTGKELVHRDSNGVMLEAGDAVVLIKDLKVKGSSMVAKQGTPVRRISLDRENEKYIEGRVDGQQIVLVTDYVKKI